jgi:hypothetical protein
MANHTKRHTGAAASTTAKATGMTKSAAIQQALVDLGTDAKPLQLQSHIKTKFNIDISTNHISAAKTDIVRKLTGAARPAPATAAAKTTPAPKTVATKTITVPRPAAKKPVAKKPAAPKAQPRPVTVIAASNSAASGSVALADIATVKALVGRVGATNLKTLIDVLVK